MTMPTVTVCGSPMSPEASRAMACLFEKDMQFQNIPMLIGAGPVQVKERDHARKFYKARGFCRYVCEQYPEKRNRELYGRNPLAKASIDEWIETEEHFEVQSTSMVYSLAIRPEDREFMNHKRQYDHRFDLKMQELGEVLDMYEKKARGKSFLGRG